MIPQIWLAHQFAKAASESLRSGGGHLGGPSPTAQSELGGGGRLV